MMLSGEHDEKEHKGRLNIDGQHEVPSDLPNEV